MPDRPVLVRFPRDPADRSAIAEARVKSRVLAFLAGLGSGKPRHVSEIRCFAVNTIARNGDLRPILERMVDRGELVAVDAVPAGNVGGDRRPYRGYAIAAGERGGAA